MAVPLTRSPCKHSSLPKKAERSSPATDLKGHQHLNQFDVAKYRELTCVDHILDGVSTLVGCFFGFTTGWITGWFLGLYVAQIYLRHFGAGVSVCFSWDRGSTLLAAAFGEVSAVIGSILGMVAVLVADRIILRKRIVFLNRKHTVTPEDISRVIGKNSRQIRRMVTKISENKKSEL